MKSQSLTGCNVWAVILSMLIHSVMMNNTSEVNIHFHQHKSFDCKRRIEILWYRLEDNI